MKKGGRKKRENCIKMGQNALKLHAGGGGVSPHTYADLPAGTLVWEKMDLKGVGEEMIEMHNISPLSNGN